MDEKFTSAINDLSDAVNSNSERLSEIKTRVSILEGEKEMDDDEEEQHHAKTEAKKVSKYANRKTKFQKELEDAAEENDHQQRLVVINMPTPDFKHIYLDSTDLAEFSMFLINWLEWERTYSLRLEPPRIMSRRLRTMLQYNHGINESEFHKLTPDTFMQLMAKETEVVDKRDFALTLKNALRNVRQLDWDKVTPATHQKFFQAILRRKEIFLKIFQVLMECNSDKCPSLKGKEFGLANIFLNTISDSYNSSIKAELQEINNTNYPKVEDFIEAYVDKAKQHYDVSRGVKRIPYAGADYPSGMRSRDDKTNGKKPWDKSRFSNDKANQQRSNYRQAYQQTKPNEQQRVNFVTVLDESSSESDTEEQRKDFDEPDSDHESELVMATNMDEDQVSSSLPEDDIFSDEQMLAVVTSSSTTVGSEKPPGNKGCVNFAIYGNCFRGTDCKNVSGHNETSAKETRQWLMKKLATVERDGYSTSVPKKDHTRN